MGAGHPHAPGAAYGHRDAVRAAVTSAVVLGMAAGIELAAALASHSASVLADAMHNAGDVLTTFILLASFAIARRPATRRFTAGYGRIEDVATLLIVFVIVVTAAVAFWVSVSRLIVPERYGQVPYSLAAAAIGIAANLAVSEYKIRVGRGVGSPALEADGVHSRIDAVVSAGALVGIGLAGIGLRVADPVAGVLITITIVYMLAGTVRDLFYRMMDAVDPRLVDEMTEAARRVDGVLAVHDVSARWVGRELWAVMHIDCAPDATLQEAHQIAERVHHEVSHDVQLARLDVHMDPGTDDHRHDRPHPGKGEPAPPRRL